MSDFHILNKVDYPDKPQALVFADAVFFTARAALGYEDITYKKVEGENKFVIEQSVKVTNVFLRILCSLATLTVLLIPSLIALAIKCTMKGTQDNDVEKLNKLVEKHVSTTKKEDGSITTTTAASSKDGKTTSQTSSSIKSETKEEKKTATKPRIDTRDAASQALAMGLMAFNGANVVMANGNAAAAVFVSGKDALVRPPIMKSSSLEVPPVKLVSDADAMRARTPSPTGSLKGVHLELSYWKQLAATKDPEKRKPIMEKLVAINHTLNFAGMNEEALRGITESNLRFLEALADFAEKASKGEPVDDLIKGNKLLRAYLADRIFFLQGGKSEKEFEEKIEKIGEDLLANPRHPLLSVIAKELKETGFIHLKFEESDEISQTTTFQETEKKAPSPSEVQTDKDLKGIDLLIACWQHLANAKNNEQRKVALQLLIDIDPQHECLLSCLLESDGAEYLTTRAKINIKDFKDYADFAKKALNETPYDHLIKKNGFLRNYLCHRIFYLEGGRTEEEWEKRCEDIEAILLANPYQDVVPQIAKELREKGYIHTKLVSAKQATDPDDGKTKSAAPSQSREVTLQGVDLQLFYWNQIARNFDSALSKTALEALRKMDPDDVKLNYPEAVKNGAEWRVNFYGALVHFADRVLNGLPVDDILRGNDQVFNFLLHRIIQLQGGGKTQAEYSASSSRIGKMLRENPDKEVLMQVAKDIKEKGGSPGFKYDFDPKQGNTITVVPAHPEKKVTIAEPKKADAVSESTPKKDPVEEVVEFYRLAGAEYPPKTILEKMFDQLIQRKETKEILLKDFKQMNKGWSQKAEKDVIEHIRKNVDQHLFFHWEDYYPTHAAGIRIL